MKSPAITSLLCLFVLASIQLKANDPSLDSHNFNQFDTLEIINASAKDLLLSCKSFYKERSKSNSVTKAFNKNDDSAICSFTDGFLLKSKVLVGMHLSGAINYEVKIRKEDNSIILQLLNPTFIPYKRDRFGKFVPESGKKIPLENLASSNFTPKHVEKIYETYRSYQQKYMFDLKLSIASKE